MSQSWQKSLSNAADDAVRRKYSAEADNRSQLPESITMELTRAPAEFAVPVKQDKCAHSDNDAIQ